MKSFTLVGLPKSIQFDQGSNFISGVFQQVMHELGIKQYRSSAYHPENQGALERFHQTLKNMIKTYYYDTNKDWDDGINLLLFAAREYVQESLGFSPFQLVCVNTARGPLNLFKEIILVQDGVPIDLYTYVSDFKLKLSKACDLTKDNLLSAQAKMKQRHDLHARERYFKPGDQVLALLPIPGQPLQARYSGPYTVDQKISGVKYAMNTPDRRKSQQLCHVNMLKQYFERDSSTTHVVSLVTPVPLDMHSDEGIDRDTKKQ